MIKANCQERADFLVLMCVLNKVGVGLDDAGGSLLTGDIL